MEGFPLFRTAVLCVFTYEVGEPLHYEVIAMFHK